MDRLRAMNVFMTVARSGSLSAAARRLGEPLTTVSRLLAALETEIGTSLITRTTRSMALTDAGRTYLETCRRVFEELDAVESQLAGSTHGVSGEITVTAPVVFGRLHLLPVACAFLARHPEVDLKLQLLDRVVDLVEEGADIALRIGSLPDSSLVATRVGTLRLLTCASAAYLKSFGVPADPSALAGHDCIAFSSFGGGPGRWIFKSAQRGRHVVRPRLRLAVNSAEAAIDAAVAGLGITRVLSYQAEGALKRRRLKSVLDGFDDTAIPVHLVQRPVRLPKLQVRHFSTFAAKALRARLS
jgi:DNA-binding transcriptional LysR family regulator